MKVEALYSIFLKHPKVTTDSRSIPEGSIFFALKGENFNGNRFAADALSKGASYAVIDEPEYAENESYIVVGNVLESLQQLARYHRDQLKIPILAITGSNGKTTTKELIAAVLAKRYRIQYTFGNLNNHIGVPLTLLTLTAETEIGIIEMGANHPGEIKALCEIANPDFGLITNIGKAHLEGFGSFEGVIRTKSELYDYIRKTNGKCFVNADNQLLMNQAKELQLIKYGQSSGNYLMGELISSDEFLVIKALFRQGWLYLKSKLIGDYNFENILAAACIGKFFLVDPLEIQTAILDYAPTNNRSQLMVTGKNTIIMDAYNANPTSMMAALINFSAKKDKERCLILGDMLELGDVSEEEHQRIVDYIDEQDIEEVFLIGPLFAKTSSIKEKKKFEHVELLSLYLKTQPIENKLILIKGSRGIHLEKVLDVIP